ncbi:hypothetical protein ACP275_08G232000 [Erythranthe tilingii]
MPDTFFTFRINHGGRFESYFDYVGGMVSVVPNIDPDLMSYFELLDMVKELGYPISSVLWYKLPNENAIALLETDHDVLKMFKLFVEKNVLQIDMFIQDIDIDMSLGDITSPLELGNDLKTAGNDLGAEGAMHLESDTDNSDPNYALSTDSDTESEALSDFRE